MFIERIEAARLKRDLLKNIVIIEMETCGPSYYGVVLERLLHSYENGIGGISSSIYAYSVQIMNDHGLFHRPLFVRRAGLPLPEVYVIHDALPGKDAASSDWAHPLFELSHLAQNALVLWGHDVTRRFVKKRRVTPEESRRLRFQMR